MSLHGNWLKFKGVTKERGFNRHHVTINHNGQIHIGRAAHIDLGRPSFNPCSREWSSGSIPDAATSGVNSR